MYIITNLYDMERIKESEIFQKGFTDILSKDLNFLLEDLNTSDTSKFCSLIAIPNSSSISKIIIKDINIIDCCNIINLHFYKNDIAKATVLLKNNYWVSIYFHKFSNPYLTNWLYKNKHLL